MDNLILTYLIKVSIAFALFYGLYALMMKKDTFFKLRRIYFLFVVIFTLLFPLFTIEIPIAKDPVPMPGYWLSEIDLSEISVESNASQAMSGWQVALIAVSLISLGYLLRFLIQLLCILKLKKDNEHETLLGCHVVRMKNKESAPFSFFGWIFINTEIRNAAELNEIIVHEQIHVRQCHSIDVVLFEILCAFFWWNPFVWLLKKEMKINLEYLADQGVLDAGFDPQKYQYVLLQVSNTNNNISLINNFNISQLKKRIIMMNRRKSRTLLSSKYLLAVPVGVALLLSNAVQASSELMNVIKESELVSEYIIEGQQDPIKKGNVFVAVEQMPAYTGGESAMHTFISQNLKYPVEAQKAGLHGRVTVRFIVKGTGEVSDVNVVRGIDPILDNEAVRVVKAMPDWKPGKQNGVAVDVYYTLPIVFRLPDSSNKIDASNGNPNEIKEKVIVSVASLRAGDEDEKVEKERPFLSVEQMPAFPGGESAMITFISQNLKYPEDAQKARVEGRVIVRFVVDEVGNITNVEIVRGIGESSDNEALRVVKSMPKWTPGKQNGVNVPVYFTLPISFKLKAETTVSSPAK